MTFVARSVRYVLRKRVRTIVLLIVLTIITTSMLSTIAVSRAAQQAAGRIEKEAVGGFVLASNLQGSMLTPRGGGMVPSRRRAQDRPTARGRFVYGPSERHR